MGKAVQKVEDALLYLLVGLAAFILVAMLSLVVGVTVRGGLPVLSWRFLTTPPSIGMTAGGISTAIFGTLALVILMTLAVVPMGVLTAIYLAEYADRRSPLTRAIREAVETLASVPTIVFWLFGLGFFVQFLGRGIDSLFFRGELNYGQPALIWSALTMAFLTVPVVIVETEQALSFIPGEQRLAAYSLGVSRWYTVSRLILPQAFPGILSGTILALSRGAGEVAPIMFTGAAYYLPYLPTQPNDQFMELGYHIYVLATQSPDIELTKPLLFGTALVLLLLTFSLNLVALLIRRAMFQRLARHRARQESPRTCEDF
ncbi:MAG: phosphate ABC transporter permease PstA [Bacillota bacterium]|nr:phosphate ABC transporter permease PstA [Bacillota bacterium]